MRRFTILHPSGRIAGLVIKRLLSEDRFADVQLTLLAEMPEKLAELQGNGRFLPAREAGQRLEQSGLNYTLIRMPALTNWPDVKYVTTERGETFEGVSVSRSSVADLVLKAMADPSFAAFASVGIVQPETAGYTRPVY